MAASDYGFFLATALTLFLILPALIMASGVMGVTPLTGVVTPFLSYGGSAMLANFAALGLLSAIHADQRPAHDFAPFRVPMRVLSGVLGVCAVLLAGVVLRVQVVSADELAIKPHLGVQADGGRRFEYNPRMLDLIRDLPRGTIFDRRGLPLATDDRRVLDEAARALRAARRAARASSVPTPGSDATRSAARAFHILGDVAHAGELDRHRTPRTSNATPTIGCADSTITASTVKTFDRAGQPMYTIHRDYRELLPALAPSLRAVACGGCRVAQPARDVRLTIDAGLQVRPRRDRRQLRAQGAGKGRGGRARSRHRAQSSRASSYPWPVSLDALKSEAASSKPETSRDSAARSRAIRRVSAGLDVQAGGRAGRAPRQGSSNHKLHLRRGCPTDASVRVSTDGRGRSATTCCDTQPHGTIGMHDGLVHSCNAYFAQLAVASARSRCSASRAGCAIRLTPDADTQAPAGARQSLPQVGYGQAQVVASPLRMATVAATIAADGDAASAVRRGGVERRAAASRPPSRCSIRPPPGSSRATCATRCSSGTGQQPARPSVADRRQDRHGGSRRRRRRTAGSSASRPYGAAKKRIAFAIVIEHAGYGGATAAPAAGEIVSAAAAAGVIGK